jgi:hypothetical protein
MFSVFGSILVIAGSFCTLLGLLVLFLVFIRPMKAPADESNRIAHLILVWEALKSPHRFVDCKFDENTRSFPYLTQDLGEFVRGNRKH